MRKIFSKEFLPFWGLALAAIAICAIFAPNSFDSKVTNLKIPTPGDVKEAFIMTSKTGENKCYLTDRRDSTVRRSRAKIPGDSWNINIAPGSENPRNPAGILLTNNKNGTIVFIPALEIENPAYPYASEFVRKKLTDKNIPELEWTQVYLNRIYGGLYLKMELPSDPTKKKGRPGPRREFLSVKGNELTLVNTLFNPDSRFFAETLLSGVFPEAAPCDPAIAWLDAASGAERSTFILDNVEPYNVYLVPLPVTIDAIYEKHFGKPLNPARDERYSKWRKAAAGDAEAPGFSEEEMIDFSVGFEKYMKDFGAALSAHRKVFGPAMEPPDMSVPSLD